MIERIWKNLKEGLERANREDRKRMLVRQEEVKRNWGKIIIKFVITLMIATIMIFLSQRG